MRTPDIEVAKKELAAIAGRIAKLEADHGEAFKRKARTRELIKIGSNFKHFFPDYEPDRSWRIFWFLKDRMKELMPMYTEWTEERKRNGDFPLSVEVRK